MKILDKAAKLEKALLDRIGRRSDIARHPIELYRAILDEIEDALEPGARGTTIFPYTSIAVMMATTDARQRATAEAVFAEPPTLQERVRARLRNAGCQDVDAVATTLTFVDGGSDQWGGREYAIEFTRQAAARLPVKRPARTRGPKEQELHLAVLAGAAGKTRYWFRDPRINLGRLSEVLDRQQRIVRQNQVAFADGEDDISQSISRTHAHIQFDAAAGDARLHDDGSTHGTRVVRAGRTINVPRGGGRGVRLQDADEVVLGQARLRVEFKPARSRRG
jgi:FHA domain